MTQRNKAAEEKIQNNRDALEALADSDLPVNWVAEQLLEVADE